MGADGLASGALGAGFFIAGNLNQTQPGEGIESRSQGAEIAAEEHGNQE